MYAIRSYYAENALDSLKQVVSRFPNSKYARDSKLKMDLAIDHIAGKHMEIGRYYFVITSYSIHYTKLYDVHVLPNLNMDSFALPSYNFV